MRIVHLDMKDIGSTKGWRFVEEAFLVGLFILASVTTAWGDFSVKRNVQSYAVEVSINRNPPVLGKNEVRVEIKDSSGKPIVDAPVSVNYFMPPMPGMPPMNYTVKASPGGSGYHATMDLIMRGPWNIVIKAVIEEKSVRMTVLIDVR